MSAIITKKQRNAHNREPRRIVLAITSDSSIRKSDVYKQYKLSTVETSVVLLCTALTGNELKSVVDKYMRYYEISTVKGDKILFLDEEKGAMLMDDDIQSNIEKRS